MLEKTTDDVAGVGVIAQRCVSYPPASSPDGATPRPPSPVVIPTRPRPEFEVGSPPTAQTLELVDSRVIQDTAGACWRITTFRVPPGANVDLFEADDLIERVPVTC